MRSRFSLSLLALSLHGSLSSGAGVLSSAAQPPAPPPCSLNGLLQNGKCVCLNNSGWTGSTCNSLSLLPAAALSAATQTYYHPSLNLSLPFDNSWGISVLPDDTPGTWHGFMTELEGNCSLSSYSSASRILHLVATSPNGPWLVSDVALHSFAHNPQVVRAVDGAWLLFHIGNPVPECNTTCHGGHPSYANATCSGASHGASVARAVSPFGPWERESYILPDNETNPSALVLKNGTIIVTARRWTAGVPFYSADSWRGPYTALPGSRFPIFPVPATTPDVAFDEDAFLYENDLGFHMLTHRQPNGTYCNAMGPEVTDCRCGGGHMYATSIFGPWFYDADMIFNCSLTTDQGNIKLHARQRPTMLFPSSHSATPKCPMLFTGASNDAVSQYYSSFTMVQTVDC
jgi:hypothetical protein